MVKSRFKGNTARDSDNVITQIVTSVGDAVTEDYLYLYRRVCVCPCVCVCVYPSDGIHVVACGPIGTKFCTHMQIHLQMVVSLIKISPVLPKGGLGGF